MMLPFCVRPRQSATGCINRKKQTCSFYRSWIICPTRENAHEIISEPIAGCLGEAEPWCSSWSCHTLLLSFIQRAPSLCLTKYEKCLLIPNPVHKMKPASGASVFSFSEILNIRRDISRRCPWLHTGDSRRSGQGFSKCQRNVYLLRATVTTILRKGQR